MKKTLKLKQETFRKVAEYFGSKEIEKFIPTEYWGITATLKIPSTKSQTPNNEFNADLIKKDGKPKSDAIRSII